MSNHPYELYLLFLNALQAEIVLPESLYKHLISRFILTLPLESAILRAEEVYAVRRQYNSGATGLFPSKSTAMAISLHRDMMSCDGGTNQS